MQPLVVVLVSIGAVLLASYLYQQGQPSPASKAKLPAFPGTGNAIAQPRGSVLPPPPQPDFIHEDDLPAVKELIDLGWLPADVKCTDDPPLSCLPDGHVSKLYVATSLRRRRPAYSQHFSAQRRRRPGTDWPDPARSL